jgi:hydroxyethylthiazole kinase-like uncharacterized protein yjeF
MPAIFTTAQIRAIEQNHGTDGLMEKAGLAAAALARELTDDGLPILILAGPGNNGGDALVAARHLKDTWFAVDVVFTGDAQKLPADAAAAYAAWIACGGELLQAIPTASNYSLVIDGLFGIGLTRDLDARHVALVETVNAMDASILALDVPSGLCADTGRVFGASIVADHTLTFLGLKPGLCTLDGPDHAGMVHVTDLGVLLLPSPGQLINDYPILPTPRRKNSHKGINGSVAVLGGATAMTGAALLAARAALLCGAGRVYCSLLADDAPAVDLVQPELMLRDGDPLLQLEGITSWVVGPGMGREPKATSLLRSALQQSSPLVLDADALHLIAANTDLQSDLIPRAATILTPHPGEAASLLACSTAEIQQDRVAAALRIAQQYHAIVVLKGCGSIVATPDGRWFINTSGNPGLSSAGMGDVLAGIIGSLIAQGMEPLGAALLGVYLHGAAADSLVANGVGPVGLTASEVALEARSLLNKLQNE